MQIWYMYLHTLKRTGQREKDGERDWGDEIDENYEKREGREREIFKHTCIDKAWVK